MIPIKLSEELNPNLIYDEVYQRYTLNRLNGTLKLKVKIPENGKYMLCMKYNSISCPKLALFCDEKLIDNNFCKTKTGSTDYIISLNYKSGPYLFNQGDIELEIKSIGRFPEVYDIYIEKYEPLPYLVYQYKPADFLIIRNFNVYGGFYWNLNNILVGLTICDIYKKIPVICLDTGFYMNNTDLEGTMIKYCPNWFSYYFQDPVNIPGALYSYLVSTKKKVPCTPTMLKKKNPNFIYAYNRKSFNIFSKIERKKEICEKYLNLHPVLEGFIGEIKKKVFPEDEDENFKYIGIHYRGTDKIAEDSSPEEYPIHYEYQKIYDIVNSKKEEMETVENVKVYIVITSDEMPFIEFMEEKLGDRVLYYKEALRSSTNTSGMKEDFEKIKPRNIKIDTSNLSEDEQKTYNLRDSLINSSIHIGYKDSSNYKKGLDCIVDAKLLDKCDVLYKSKGNFSLFCYYFNKKENLELFDLNELVTNQNSS